MAQETSNEKPVLVVGGTGKTGRRVAERLTALGRPVRVTSRSNPQAPFDWEDPSSWARCVEGAGSAYVTYSPDLAFPGADQQIRAFSDLAVANGVGRLVLLAGRGEAGAEASEDQMKASGADWTVLRSAFFCQDFSEAFFLEPVMSGVLALPAGDVAEPFVDADDIAEVAVTALGDDRHVGQTYELTGPRLLTFADAVAEISKASGRQVSYVAVSADEWLAGAIEAGVPQDVAHGLVALFGEVLDGRNQHVADGVQRALGREPRDFSDYVRDTAATGVWSGGLAEQ